MKSWDMNESVREGTGSNTAAETTQRSRSRSYLARGNEGLFDARQSKGA